MFRIMAVDDDKSYLDSLVEENRFKPHQLTPIYQVQETENIPWLLQKIVEQQPDIILMDISFRHQSKEFGITLTGIIRQKFPRQKIIMLTADDPIVGSELVGKIERSFEAGANAYLSKMDNAEYCMEAFEEVFVSQDAVASDALWKRILNSFKHKKDAAHQHSKLTPRQVEVLQQFSMDKDYSGVSEALNITQQGVAFHVRQIKIKMKNITIQGLVAEALRKGLID